MVLGLDIVDVHSHVLPGLDDGPQDLDRSLQMCQAYQADGVRTVVATPHMCDVRFPVTAEIVRQGVRQLSLACRQAAIELQILPGGDVRLQPELLDDLEAGRALTVADNGRYLLLELPPYAVSGIDRLLLQLVVLGITPIVSHPERTPDLCRKQARLAALVAGGCLVQVTAGSFLGVFGSTARRAAERLLEAGLVQVVASDAHSPQGGRRPAFAAVVERLAELAGAEEARALVCDNPARIVRGESVARPSGAASAAGQQ